MAEKNKNRKVGRNAAACKAYELSKTREHNKIVRLDRHLKRFGADNCAIEAKDRAKRAIRGY